MLEHRGPLSPTELAEEGHMSREKATEAVEELEEEGFVQSVCGLRESREEVFALTETGTESDATVV
ncbi:MAG: MarR family transcriptional regulator [Halodesulfurarchaeum sp.]